VKRALFSFAGVIGLLTVSLAGFSSIYSGSVGTLGAGQFGSIFGGSAGMLAGGQFGSAYSGAVGSLGAGQFGSVFNGAVGTLASGQFGSIFPAGTSAPPAFVQKCNQNGGGSPVASVSCTMTTTSGNLVVLIGVTDQARVNGADASGCSDNNGGSYVYIQRSGGAFPLIKMCYAANVAGGSTTFTWTNQGGADWSQIVVAEFSSMPTSGTIIDQIAQSSGSGANADSGTTSATTHAADISVVAAARAGAGTWTCAGDYTELAEDETFVSISFSACYKILSATGTQSMTWTSTAGGWSSSIGVLKGL